MAADSFLLVVRSTPPKKKDSPNLTPIGTVLLDDGSMSVDDDDDVCFSLHIDSIFKEFFYILTVYSKNQLHFTRVIVID